MKTLYTNMVNVDEYVIENAEYFDEELTWNERIELAWEQVNNWDWNDFEQGLQGATIEGRAILAIADLGRWNGRYQGYRVIHSSNILSCLSDAGSYDYVTFYTDKAGDFRMDGVHHDGKDYITYREVKETTTERQLDKLTQKIYDGEATRADITRYTRGIGKKVLKALEY